MMLAKQVQWMAIMAVLAQGWRVNSKKVLMNSMILPQVEKRFRNSLMFRSIISFRT